MIQFNLRALVALLFLVGNVPASASPIDSAERREVSIPAGEITLAATLYRPAAAKGDIPAVVLGHGSAPSTRAMMSFWTNIALQTGLAVLVFDKRGTGKSTGQFQEWDVAKTPKLFEDQASDLGHAVRWLAKQRGVDVRHLGLMGGSQAGWTMPLAAFQEPIVRFLVIGEGVPLPAGVEEAHGHYLWATRRNREGKPELRQVLGADLMGLDYAAQKGFDPAPVLEKLTVPTLWIFGLYDTDIPTRQSIDRIGQLQQMGRRNHDIHIFPFGDHNFQDAFSGERYDLAKVSRQWLQELQILP